MVSPVPDESRLWLLQAAVGHLQQVVTELGQVGAGTRQVADRIHALSSIDWRSPAGEAFAERSRRLRARAQQLAEEAEASAQLGRNAITDLEHRIGRLQAELAAARTVLAAGAGLGIG
ncbi:hypothetical protein E7744_01545 [Citricoccus sp. SGAir0253]|uniref:hypothetical protein n=1 Tax=Citricoccus sp. SGAir0253 TaxID=2567881 RepID=UPI0010CD444C|nr:hypothetical protein [Citricoccus sp. SGAir0253]QCU77050.1 hypothetical protein E7744_01545 [Citricoccus sp. SGAir0253]